MMDVKRQRLSVPIFDENTMKVISKTKTIVATNKRPALGDIANQKLPLKSAEVGKILKNPKPKPKGSSAAKAQRTKVGVKDDIPEDNDMNDIDQYLEGQQDQDMMEHWVDQLHQEELQKELEQEQKELESEIMKEEQKEGEKEVENEKENVGGEEIVLEVKSEDLDQIRLAMAEEEAHKDHLLKLGIVDLDLEDATDPLAVTEYVIPIFKYLLSLEVKFQPPADYMEKQKELTWKMRSTLNNWIVEVHWKYKLFPETLFLTISIVDRFLAVHQVTRDQLQLVGIASMLIASKFEEIYSPTVEDFLAVCHDGYKNEDLLKMERLILIKLGFELGGPCSLTFLRRISKAEQYDIPSRTVSKYLIEVTVLDERFLNYYPSMIAAASTWLSRKMLKKGDWNKYLEFYSGYSESSLEKCVNDMLGFLQQNTTPTANNNNNNAKLKAISKKYASTKFLRASLFVDQKIAAWMRGEDGPSPPNEES